MSSSNVNTSAVTNETKFSYSKSLFFLSAFYPLLTSFFNFADIAPRPTIHRLRIDADDASQMHAEIGAENWDQTPAKGWKIEKKLHQVGLVDKIHIMVPKGIPPEAKQKEAFVCFRMLGARACLRCVQNKLKCSFNIPEGEDGDGNDENDDDEEEYDGEDGPPTIGIVAEASPMPSRPKC